LIRGDYTDFSFLNLSGLDFSMSHPKGASFYGCNLDNCKFIRGCLCDFDVRYASVRNCTFRDIYEINFTPDTVKGADFTGSDFGEN
jgi:uncharacterized protein YjbI with pentapeptide repeats